MQITLAVQQLVTRGRRPPAAKDQSAGRRRTCRTSRYPPYARVLTIAPSTAPETINRGTQALCAMPPTRQPSHPRCETCIAATRPPTSPSAEPTSRNRDIRIARGASITRSVSCGDTRADGERSSARSVSAALGFDDRTGACAMTAANGADTSTAMITTLRIRPPT